MRVEIKQRGVDSAVVGLRHVALRAADVRPVQRELQAVFLAEQRRRFGNRGDGRWPPLAAATRAKKGGRGQLLRDTDRLYRSLTVAGAANQVNYAGQSSFRFGTTLSYALFHLGTRKMPQRLPIGVRPAARAEMKLVLMRYVRGRAG